MTNPDLGKALQAHSCCIWLQAQHMDLGGKCMYCAAQGDLCLGLTGEIFWLLKEPRSPVFTRAIFNKFLSSWRRRLSVGFHSPLELYIFQTPNFVLERKNKNIQASDHIYLNQFPAVLYILSLVLSHQKSLMTWVRRLKNEAVACDFLLTWKCVLHPAVTEQEFSCWSRWKCPVHMDCKDLWPWHHCRSVRSRGQMGCVSRESKPPLLTSNSGASDDFWGWCCLISQCQAVSGGTGPAQGAAQDCSALAAEVSPFPCSAAWAEHTLQAAAWPSAEGSGVGSSSCKRLLLCCELLGHWGSPSQGEQLSSGQSASLRQSHETELLTRVSWGLSLDTLTEMGEQAGG